MKYTSDKLLFLLLKMNTMAEQQQVRTGLSDIIIVSTYSKGCIINYEITVSQNKCQINMFLPLEILSEALL